VYIPFQEATPQESKLFWQFFSSFNEIIETLLVLSSISFIVMTTGVDALWGNK